MFSKIKKLLIILCALGYCIYGAKPVPAQSQDELQQVLRSRADSVNSVAFVPNNDKVIASVRSGQGGQLVVVSLRDCVEEKRFNYPSSIPSIIISKIDSGSVWGSQGSMLKKWSLVDGQELFTQQLTDNEAIKGVIQSADGDYIGVWSETKVAVVKLADNNQAALAWKETTSYPVSALAVDSQGGHIYIGGSDGTLVKRTLNGGTMSNSFAIDYPIMSLAVNPLMDHLIIGSTNQLLKLDLKDTVFSRISILPAYDLTFSDDFKILAVIGNRGYSLFSYPDLKVIHTQNLTGTKLSMMPNGSVVTFDNNMLRFYDQKKRADAGTIYLYDNTVGYASADKNYYGNDLFRTAILTGQASGLASYIASDREPDKNKACTAFRDMVTSVSTPVATAPPAPPAPITVPPLTPPSTTQPTRPAVVPSIPPPTAQPPVSTVAPSVTVSPSTPPPAEVVQVTPTPSLVQPPVRPQVTPVTPPAIATGTNIPSWVLNPNTLPAYSAVRSGNDTSTALTESKRKIRDDIARNVMKTMLEVELVREIEDDEVKKRFLWMVAGRTAQTSSEYVIQTDMWVSPQSQYYVLAQIDLESVNQIYEPTFREEMEQLRSYGDTEYLKREPVKWE